MITELTNAQEARFQEFLDKWTAIGLCTDPADRKAAEEGILMVYLFAHLRPPKNIVWCKSPFSQELTRGIVLDLLQKHPDSQWDSGWDSVLDSAEDTVRASQMASIPASLRGYAVQQADSLWATTKASVGDSMWASVKASVKASVTDSVGNLVKASVGDSVGDSVHTSMGRTQWPSEKVENLMLDSVWDSVWASVGNPVWFSVWPSVANSLWHSLGESLGDTFPGQHDAGHASVFDYFREVCGLSQETQQMTGILQIARSANWWLPHENICWISERHHVLKRDERGRLHCPNGPALLYPDGWGFWAWHGIRVSPEIIEKPETITTKQIENETSAEIRRVLIERYGFDRYLKDGNFFLVQQDDFGRLYRKKVPGEPDMVFVRVINSTPEPDGSYSEYVLPCRSTVRTAHEAVATSFGLSVEEYAPSFES
jgi:hypothetical protein